MGCGGYDWLLFLLFFLENLVVFLSCYFNREPRCSTVRKRVQYWYLSIVLIRVKQTSIYNTLLCWHQAHLPDDNSQPHSIQTISTQKGVQVTNILCWDAFGMGFRCQPFLTAVVLKSRPTVIKLQYQQFFCLCLLRAFSCSRATTTDTPSQQGGTRRSWFDLGFGMIVGLGIIAGFGHWIRWLDSVVGSGFWFVSWIRYPDPVVEIRFLGSGELRC